jgi:hypothetical protein
MQISALGNAFAGDLEAGSGRERPFMVPEEGETVVRGRVEAEQRPERAAMHGTYRRMLPDREDQGFDIGTPMRFVRQGSCPS